MTSANGATGHVPSFTVEPTGQSGGTCECCHTESRTVWGFLHGGDATVAAYFVQWTVGALLSDHPANIDLVIGPWGEGARRDDRVAVAAIHFVRDGRPGIMLIDAAERPIGRSDLVGAAMTRDEVLNTPLATQAFALIDAVLLGDARLQAS